MKYIRTKDGIYEYVDYDNECIIPSPIIKYKNKLTHCSECDIIKQADTIEELPYLIDINWFRYVHCRKPYYQCINFIEFYILNNDNEPVDSICLYPSETKDGRFYEVDKERYDRIKKYMNDKGELI